MKKIFKLPMYKELDNFLLNLPTPLNLTILWNFGSLLGVCFMVQLLSGIFLTMHYAPHIDYSFMSIVHIMQDVNYGWLVRMIHMNGASFFFICVYIHIGRGLYYGSYALKLVWMIGVLILFIMMGAAFMGYVLPWGQMSFWGATVITNLVSAIPYIGEMLVSWLWGGFSVSNATLNRFYTFHFLMPFILILFVGSHLIFLHFYMSSNPLGIKSKYYMIKFHLYYSLKDIVGGVILFYLLMMIVLEWPYLMGDAENFLKANSMVTPVHIQPEWYFLFAYTILRSIPNKLGGVLALVMSILMLLVKSYLKLSNFQSMMFYYLNKFLFWLFVFNLILLTWLGSQSVEAPYVVMGQMSTVIYFMYYFTDYVMKLIWDKMLF